MEQNNNNNNNNNNHHHDQSVSSASAASKAVDFARLVGKLKTTPRTGWVRRGVPRYESVADHSWRVAVLSLLLKNNNNDNNDDETQLDVGKCMQLAVVHDLAECVVGDIAPDDNVSKEVKQQMEKDAIDQISSTLHKATISVSEKESNGNKGGDNETQSEHMLMELFHEYEERKSKEARSVKDLDLLDMIIQADEYEQRFDMDLSDFFDSTPVNRFQNAVVKSIAQEVHNQRQSRLAKRQKKEEGNSNDSGLSKSDMAFIEEYATASTLDLDSIKQVVKAYAEWNKK